MIRLIKWMPILIALVSFCSCNRDLTAIEDDEKVTSIRVIGPEDILFEGIPTRGTEITSGDVLRFSWSLSDTLGIFPSQGNQVEFPITATDGGTSAVFDGGSWGLKNNATYAAYYPFSVWNYHRDNKTIMLDYSGQVQDGNRSFAHLSAYDYLASSRLPVANGTVTFKMERMGSILYIDMVVPKPSTVNSLVISCDEAIFVEKAALDVSGTDASFSPIKMTNALTLSFNNLATTQSDENVRAYMAVSPINFSDKTVYATLYTSAGRLGAAVVSREVKQGKAAFLRFAEAFTPAIIQFVDPEVKRLCVSKWDLDGDGELSYDEAAVVTDLGDVFNQNSTIASFEELRYFTGLTKINSKAFYGCSNLEKVIIPENVITIESEAFYGCGLSSLTIPGNVANISFRSFAECKNLSEITLSEGLERIGESAFRGCSSLTSINIPESVSSIGKSSFSECSSLQSFNGKFSSIDHRFLIEDGSIIAFASEGITDIIIPEGVTCISQEVFYQCVDLKSVVIPGSVEIIEYNAFRGCTGLTSMVIPEGVTKIGNHAFFGCTNLSSCDIPNGVTSIGIYAFSNSGLKSIVIPGSVQDFGNWMFEGCSDLTKVVISEGITKIGSYAFKQCTNLSSCDIPNGVTLIGNGAFQNCSKLTSIVLPDSVTEIGSYAFAYCSGLTSLIIPDSVTEIGSYAFAYCSELTSVTLSSAITCIKNSSFSGCKKLASVVVPEGVISIEENAFFSCTALAIVTLPEGLTSIGGSAFWGSKGITSITIPSSVNSIGDYAFQFCSNLTSITVLATVPPAIGSGVFSNIGASFTIRVPSGKATTYKKAENWSEYASYIK